MSAREYLMLIRRIPVKSRNVVREGNCFKVYLPKEYNELWNVLYEDKKSIDVLVILPKSVVERHFTDKVLIMNKHVAKETNRYKIYLNSKNRAIWDDIRVNNEKLDLILILK